jgi:glycosyltransferase involved in cell wall biosynthesis
MRRSNKVEETKNECADRNNDDDTWIDRALDVLRGRRLPPVLEMVLSGIICIGCLLYYGYSYLTGLRTTKTKKRVPLMTHVRLQRQRQRDASSNTDDEHDLETLADSICRKLGGDGAKEMSNEDWVGKIRADAELRRNVSQFVLRVDELGGASGTNNNNCRKQKLYDRLISIYLDLLPFPPICVKSEEVRDTTTATISEFTISLIVPVYRERGSAVTQTLQTALQRCRCPSTVQVIVVDAGGHNKNSDGNVDDHDDNLLPLSVMESREWGEFKLVRYEGTGGRGCCLNTGAHHATGTLLTFLHSDTVIPIDWDVKVRTTLMVTTTTATATTGRGSTNSIVQACAFTFGHDTSQLNGMSYPWGIRAVWILGNVRAYCFSLPYGDHILSIPAAYFQYVGGYPQQSIMEDYDLMDLFRQRAAILSERIRIIAPPSGRCSVRRWQQLGVPYVTLVNALLVHRYAHGGWTAGQVFDYYYRRPFRTTIASASTRKDV